MELKRLFTIEECKEIINHAENDDTYQWEEKIENDSNGDLFLRYFVKSLNTHVFAREKFQKFVNDEFSFNVHNTNLYILKYLSGFKFGRHFDRNLSKELNRDFVYNVNVVLNDDFEGGEFWLDDNLLENNKPGMVYYYDSLQWHEVKEIKNGVRYSILCYVRERDFITKEKKSLI
jgi:predicted 2-oxoglutarate/Fe(II)-dependent dioxygenase YbiX